MESYYAPLVMMDTALNELPAIKCLPYEIYRPQIYGLCNQGWTILDLLGCETHVSPLNFSYKTLLDALKGNALGHSRPWKSTKKILPLVEKLITCSTTFFDDAPDSSKRIYDKGDSEEGWTKIDGEKEFLTIRGLTGRTPEQVSKPAADAWEEGLWPFFFDVLRHLEAAMQLREGALTRYILSSRKLDDENSYSMIRIFRYDNDVEFKRLAEGQSIIVFNMFP